MRTQNGKMVGRPKKGAAIIPAPKPLYAHTFRTCHQRLVFILVPLYTFRALLSSMLLVSFFISLTEAREFLVGGKTNAWKTPSSESESLNKWAEASRFQVGDSLVWNYDPSKDSLLQVSKKDYDSCNTSSPIAVYKDGNTKVKLDRSGPFYFISGTRGNCEKGLKLVTVVLSGRRKFFNVSPAPSPVEFEGPAVAPTSDGTSLRGGFMAIFGLLMRLVFLEMLM